jgi:hypothetical protein
MCSKPLRSFERSVSELDPKLRGKFLTALKGEGWLNEAF